MALAQHDTKNKSTIIYLTSTTYKRTISVRVKIVSTRNSKGVKMSNHWSCSVDVTKEPFYCSDHDLYLNDDGTDFVVLTDEVDEDTIDYTGAEPTPA